MDHTDRGLVTTMIIIGIIIIILLITRGSIGSAYTSYNYRAGNGLTASAVPFDDTSFNTQPTYYTGSASTSVRALSRPSTTAGTRTTTYYTYSTPSTTTYDYPSTTYYSEGCAAGYTYSATTGAPCYQAMN